MTLADRLPKRARICLALLIASAVVACALYQLLGRDFPFYGDEVELFSAAKGIQQGGLFSAFKFSDRRPYLYPLILSQLPAQRDFIFGAHLLAFECAAAYVFLFFTARSRALNAWLVGCVIFLNPFVLLYLGYALTETFSLVFILVSAVLLVNACERARSRVLSAFLVGALFGCAAMVRPSNLFLLGAVPLLLGFDWLAPRPSAGGVRARLRASLARLSGLAAGFCLLVLPQFHNNLRYYQSATPIVVSFARQESSDAALVERSIKYATAISKKNRAVAAVYPDPYQEARHSEKPWVSLAARCAKRVTTLFALIDQDRPIPYNRNMFPWFRAPASVGSLALFFAGLVGILAELASGLHRPSGLRHKLAALYDPERLPALLFGALGFGCLLAFSRFHTEARYGLPALVLVACFLPHAWAHWLRFGARTRVAVGAAFAAWMALGLFLSFWIERGLPR